MSCVCGMQKDVELIEGGSVFVGEEQRAGFVWNEQLFVSHRITLDFYTES